MKVSELPREDVASAFAFLDALRESGEANMFTEAGAYLAANMDWERNTVRPVHLAWMETFDGKRPLDERVDLALTSPA